MIAGVTVMVFNNSTAYNLTSRVYGAACSTNCVPGQFGRGTASFDFLNNDGAMTPGNGGTYSSVDWFSMGISIPFTTSQGYGTCFAGIITDFSLVDDGKNSFVRITAVDGFAIGGSTATTVNTGATTVAGTVKYWIDSFFNGNSTYITSVGMPKLGGTVATAVGTDVGRSSTGLATKNYSATGRALDFVNNSVMPAGPNFAWPTDITSSGTAMYYNYNCANLYPLRATSTVAFTFAQSPTSGQLPIQNLVRKFNSDDLLNDSSVATLPIIFDGSTYTDTEENTASKSLYGNRTISLNAILPGAVTGANSQLPGSANSSAGTVAQRWANTYSSVSFVTDSLVVSDTSMTTNANNSSSINAYTKLLDISQGVLQLAQVKYKPTGGAATRTDNVIIMGRDIQFTLDDVRIRVNFMIANRSAFILNDTVLGVLDTNRLG